MHGLTSFPQVFSIGCWLILATGLNAAPAFAQAELNLRSGESVDVARVIVKFRQDSSMVRRHTLSAKASASETLDKVTARANSLGTRLGLTLRTGRALTSHVQVISAKGISAATLAARLTAEADVEYAVIDYRRKHFGSPTDPMYTQGPPINGSAGGPAAGQWYLRPPSTTVISSINARGAWDLTTGSSSIVVAVLDTGVRPEHPELINRLLPGYNMVSDIPTGNDGEGRDADASDPGDWVTQSESSDPSGAFYECGAADSSWHGTQTTSLIGAASNNGIGMAGVAWGVKLLPVRVLGKCGGHDSDIIAGMQWAAGLPVPGVPTNPTPARVINMSLGSNDTCPQSYIDAINSITNKSDPAVIVVAAGNSSGLAVASPANCPGVIAVAGLRHIGTKVGFSDVGPEISISAPAGNCVNSTSGMPCLYPILAATNTGLTTPVASTYTDSFNYGVGTSFAAPLVSGTVALMMSVKPSLTPDQVLEILQRTARPFPISGAAATVQNCRAPNTHVQLECYCTASTCGAGMLDAAAAVSSVSPSIQVSMAVVQGWNLLGNGVDAPIVVATTFNDATKVNTIWKWLPSGTTSGIAYPTWAFYTPTQADRGQAYAQGKGYDFLTTINAGEGFWVNAATAFTTSPTSGVAVQSSSFQPSIAATSGGARALPSGWSLIASGDNLTPAQFDAAIAMAGSTPPTAGQVYTSLNTLWAWDATKQNWYFWAPSLVNSGGLASYLSSKNYLDSSTMPSTPAGTLSPAAGFWVNVP